LVRVKVALELMAKAPDVVAVTVYTPGVPFAVTNPLEAVPLAEVFTVIVFMLLLNVALAPVAGAVNTTGTPATTFPFLSRTCTVSGKVNALTVGADCGVPLSGLMVAGPFTLNVWVTAVAAL
jgi:hypothetical protein